MSVHPRLSVSSISSLRQPLEDDLALWSELGITHVGLTSPKLDAAGWDTSLEAVRDAGLRVSSVSAFREEPVDFAFMTGVGCGLLYTVSGYGGMALWEDAASRFCEEIAPFIADATEAAVGVAIEPTNPLRSDVSFVHSVRDAVDLARMAGMGVVVDFYSSWYERGLDDLLRENIDLVALVQINDYKLGTFDMPNRCAIGDGDLPVERLLKMVLDAGYEGPFDLELIGPVIEEEGYRGAIARERRARGRDARPPRRLRARRRCASRRPLPAVLGDDNPYAPRGSGSACAECRDRPRVATSRAAPRSRCQVRCRCGSRRGAPTAR